MIRVDPAELITVFICGSALRGQPDHKNLSGAQFLGEIRTASVYRLHAVGDGWHPGIYPVDQGGISIPGELYAMNREQFDHLNTNEPPHMYPESISLANGDTAVAFLYPKALIDENGWPDISDYGGWAAYKSATDQP